MQLLCSVFGFIVQLISYSVLLLNITWNIHKICHNMSNVKLLPFFVPSSLNSYSLYFHHYRRASRMSRPAMLTKFLRRHRRLLSKSWTRASSREARWIRTSWRGVTSCCELMFFAELFICGHKPLTGCRGESTVLYRHALAETFPIWHICLQLFLLLNPGP